MNEIAAHHEQTCRVRMSDGAALFCRRWRPRGLSGRKTPRGTVLALHGIQSHSGWYGWSSSRLAEAGYEVWFPDRRGSGQSTQPEAQNISIERLTADVVELLDRLRGESRHRAAADGTSPWPVFLLGLSWGGKLAAAVAAATPGLVDGLILLYPGLVAQVGPTPFQQAALRKICGAGQGGLRLKIPLDDPQLFTDDPAAQKFIRTDPLALHKARADLLHASVLLDRRVQDPRFVLDVPTLLMLAGRDRIIDTPATRQLVERAAGDRCTTCVYLQAAHTLEFDGDRETIFGQLIDWLNGHTTPGPADC